MNNDSGAAPRERVFTPRGQMSAGANNRPPLSDLPPNMRMMFEPRPPLAFKAPCPQRETKPYSGIAQYTSNFEHSEPPPVAKFESPIERKKRLREEVQKLNSEKIELMVADWDPQSNKETTKNAYHTLFVGRLAFDITEKKLRREMEQFGNVVNAKIVADREGKSRGYGFVEFEKEEDMTAAFKKSDGKKLEGRRIVVDVERGRTVRNWRPRRFGGGLGGRKAVKSKKALEEEQKSVGGAAADRGRPTSYGPSASTAPPPSARQTDTKYGPGAGPGPGAGSDSAASSRYGPSTGTTARRESGGSVPDSRYGPGPSRRSRSRSKDKDRDRDRSNRDNRDRNPRDQRDYRDRGSGNGHREEERRRRSRSRSPARRY